MKLKLLFSAFCSLALITGVNLDSQASSSQLVQSKYNPNFMVEKSLSVYMINGREIYEYFPELEYLREERFFANLARLESVPDAAFGNMLANLNRVFTTTNSLDLSRELFRFNNFYYSSKYADMYNPNDTWIYGEVDAAMREIAKAFISYRDNKEISLADRESFNTFTAGGYLRICRDFWRWADVVKDLGWDQFIQGITKYDSFNEQFDMFINYMAKKDSRYRTMMNIAGKSVKKLVYYTYGILIDSFLTFIHSNKANKSNVVAFTDVNFEITRRTLWVHAFSHYAFVQGKNKVNESYKLNSKIWFIGNGYYVATLREYIKDLVENMVKEKDPKQFEFYHGKLPESKTSN